MLYNMNASNFFSFTRSMSFDRFLMGNISNSIQQAYVTLVRGLTCFKKNLQDIVLYRNFSLRNASGGAKPYYGLNFTFSHLQTILYN